MSTAPTDPPPVRIGEDRHFEDFAVGQRFTSGPREVTAADLAEFTRLSGDDHPLHTDPAYPAGPGRPVLQGPFGPAVAMGLVQRLGLVGDAVLGLLDTHWHYRRPVHVGDVLRLEMTIVRCRRTRRADRGVVTRHMRLVDAEGRVVQEGTTAVLLAARGTGPDPVGRDFGSVAWGEALAARLGPGTEFAEALASWDGTIGLRAGDHEVHLRVYRGAVIEVAARSALGASFTVEADELTWTELMDAETNDFTRRAMAGQFAVRGNGYEYLRLTRPLSLVVDAARALAAQRREAVA
ncbi:MaoC/PaaZ C-terminal domain-containing protein [Pseudonocardia nigra]|uniref:MaoC/PaaZ C-terminal domain-containing protein n=1 Tax=Pseudonocardia nigra TaxID=1921578 RepID=UPI001C5DB07B|nr:MaoC/PaaZ C-terminal domain-containing protein [Pseudonocardia nigra]